MTRKQEKKRKRRFVPTYASFTPAMRKWIERHQARLERETGGWVWRSEAIRDLLEHSYHNREALGVK